MINLNLGVGNDADLTVLCLGSHSDDIEIGCGGTILRLIEQYPACKFYWVVFSAIGVRKAEAQRGAELFAGTERLERILLKDFPDGFMPFVGSEVKSVDLSAIGVRKAEAQRGAELFAGTERLERILLKDFPDGFMPFVGSEVKS